MIHLRLTWHNDMEEHKVFHIYSLYIMSKCINLYVLEKKNHIYIYNSTQNSSKS